MLAIGLNIGVGDKGLREAAALPALEKYAKSSHDGTENRPKVGQIFVNSGSFIGQPPKFYPPPLRLWTLGSVYTGSVPFGTVPKWVRLGLAFTGDPLEPFQMELLAVPK